MVVGEFTQDTDLLVIGGGPGGYHAAFRAAENGIQTTIVDRMPALGGVCLHRGCIPSKTYLAMAETMHAAASAKQMGVTFSKPKLDVAAMRGWKDSVIGKLSGGLDMLCKKHKIERLTGIARFEDGKYAAIEGGDVPRVKFKRAIVATGSRTIELRGIQIESENVLSSRTALNLDSIPKTLLVIGGGYIGLELGQVYAGFGSKVTVVEMTPSLLPGCDRDLVRPLAKRLADDFAEICLETRVTGMKEVKGGIDVSFDGKNAPKVTTFAKVLVAVGRRPNTEDVGLDKAGVALNDRGFIKVNDNFQTSSAKIYAIGDVIGDPMLAHKAQHEGMVLADQLAGKDVVFEPRAIPAVVFTDPGIAWAGLTEEEAKTKGLDFKIKKMPWSASGRAVAIGRTDGVSKLILENGTDRVLGVGLAGTHVGEMISEAVLAVEMGAVGYDIATMIHPHPTLSEMLGEAAHISR